MLAIINLFQNMFLSHLCTMNFEILIHQNEVSSRFLKYAAFCFKLPITFIVYMSLSESYVPDDMEKTRVKPLYKKNGNHDVGNYRAFSTLSIVSMFLEKSVYVQLEKILIDNNLLYQLQSSFRNDHSTDTCLVHLIDHIRKKVPMDYIPV